jgi:hypothetical protein
MLRVISKFLLIIMTNATLFSQLTYNVKDFGAKGNGTNDDTKYIQAAIDALSNAGGGTVFFPEGTYIINPIPESAFIQVICLQLRNNIAFKGESQQNSIIKLAPNAIAYDAMIGAKPSSSRVDNIAISNLTIDGNADNNSIPTQEILFNSGGRSLFRLFLCNNLEISDCHFTNSKGIWNVVLNGLIQNVKINNNIFDKIGDDKNDWDHSSIYTNGNNILIENNAFRSRYGGGTLGARTAMEIHGSNQIVRNNMIDGFSYGINITCYSTIYQSRNQWYYNNIFKDVLDGLVLWSGTLSNPEAANGLANVNIFDNTIIVYKELWKDWQFSNCGSGIKTYPERERIIDSLYVFNNDISFVGPPCSGDTDSRYACGFLFRNNTAKEPYPLRNIYLVNNKIKDASGAAFYIEEKSENIVVKNNEITNPVLSTSTMWPGFRSIVFINDSLINAEISCNNIKLNKDFLPSQIVYQYDVSLNQDLLYNNSIDEPNIPVLVVNADFENYKMNQIPSKSFVSFLQDTLLVKKDGENTFTIERTEKLESEFVAHLLPIYTEFEWDTAWSIEAKEVVFKPGESSKKIKIEAIDQDAGPIYLMLLDDTTYHLGCKSLLRIELDTQNVSTSTAIIKPNGEEMTIYPNPTRDFIVIKSNFIVGQSIEVINALGQVVMRSSNVNITDEYTLNIQSLNAGFYFVKAGKHYGQFIKRE